MKIAVIIPALNPDENLIDYVDELLKSTEVVVIDDGSDKKSLYTFGALSLRSGCTVLKHECNKGKGAALKTAIAYIDKYMTHIEGVVTADADGQHSIVDVLRMANALKDNRNDLVLGVREFSENTPTRSLLGNRISAKTLQLLYGIKLNDTQTGLRAISKKYFSWLLSLKGERYEYELNMLIYSKNIGLNISTIGIETIYINNNKGSHFNTIKDGARVYFHMLFGLFFYIRNSLLCAALDIGIFTTLFYVTDSFLVATAATTFSAVTARILSSIADFKLNRATFANKTTTGKAAYLKYYTLWILQITVSTVAVNLINIYFGALQTIIKPIVDLIIAIISYKVQLHWVFKAKQPTESPSEFLDIVSDILINKNFQDMQLIHHHTLDCSRFDHSTFVAYTSYSICNALGLDATAAARGGMLHDFIIPSLLDSEVKSIKMLFIHNRIATQHALTCFDITEKEYNIIVSHMWPLSIRGLPLSPEAIIVNVVDNLCAVVEVLGLYRYTKAAKELQLQRDCHYLI